MVNHLVAVAVVWQKERLRLVARERANAQFEGLAPRPRRAPIVRTIAAATAILVVTGLAAAPSAFGAAIKAQASYTRAEAANLETARRFFEELHDEGDLAVAEKIVGQDAVFHIPGGELTGPEGIDGLVTLLRTAFPDAVFPMEQVAVDGDTVAVRWTMHGTSLGEFQGIPPTGVPVELRGTAFLRFEDGQIVEDWVTYDQLGLQQQLGVMADPEESPS